MSVMGFPGRRSPHKFTWDLNDDGVASHLATADSGLNQRLYFTQRLPALGTP